MNLQIKDKVVPVTGGAKGIGEAISKACAQEAAPVVVDRDAGACKHLHNTFQSHGWQATVACADLLAANKCEDVVKQTVSQLGRIDALVNHAGINDKVGLEQGNSEEFASSLGRNLLHYYNMAHYSLPHLKQKHGLIVNISSKTTLTGQGGTSGYVAAKAAILDMTREWAAELLPYGIRVNASPPKC